MNGLRILVVFALVWGAAVMTAAQSAQSPQAAQAHVQDIDLTRAERAARNPDGVVFYKIWNGRAQPKMPVFSEKLTKDQAWAIVAYVQTLRAK